MPKITIRSCALCKHYQPHEYKSVYTDNILKIMQCFNSNSPNYKYNTGKQSRCEEFEGKIMVSNTAVKMEELARKQAFLKFQENILFSLNVWQIDESVRQNLPSVRDWVAECVSILEKITERNDT